MTYLTADEIRALPERAVIMWHGKDGNLIAYQRRRDLWWGAMLGHGLTMLSLCFGIDIHGDRYTLAWTPEAES